MNRLGDPFLAPGRLTVIAVRHGSTELTGLALNGSGLGAADPDLSSRGLAECESTRRQLERWGLLDRLSHTVTSPARRAIATAEILTGHQGTTDARLCEVDFGSWEGSNPEWIWRKDREAYSQWQRDPTVAPPGGTSLAEAAMRVRDWRTQLHDEVSDGDVATVLVAAHASTVRILLADALHMQLEHALRIAVGPGTAALINFWADGGSSLEALRPGSPYG